jgi:UDP-N-acetylglucosamine diphosphorylase / glucose-1-phosphate thymidylyltransferase / UDP-N-acetylgalactosamine diphosphorylase / glucosamine-1-phosphate N-acetyltransferase / galactosamine-1-phosphate N-acetyltransferase
MSPRRRVSTSTIIFEDEGWTNFTPIASTRHVAQQILGSRTVVEHFAARAEGAVSLAGRDYLAESVREETGLGYNEKPDGKVLIINARIDPSVDLEGIVAGKSGFALIDKTGVAMAILSKDDYAQCQSPDGTLSGEKLLSVANGLERLETARAVLFRYPWEVLAANEDALKTTAGKAKVEKLNISPDAQVEEFVSFDTSGGPITVEAGTHIESLSRISGPCHIGAKTIVHSALVRGGTTIGGDCRIGGEVEASIIYPHANKAHFGFIGHAVVGEWVNLGAGSTTSDLKNTYGTVRVERASGRVESGMRKLGPMIADMAKLSIGTMLYGGKTVGVSAHCSGRVARDVPDFTSYDGISDQSFELTLHSVIETQERMTARRSAKLTPAKRRLIERLYSNKA